MRRPVSFRAERLAALCLVPSTAKAAGVPTDPDLIAAKEALFVRWHVTSLSRVTGFRVSYRRLNTPGRPWSAPIERSASARGVKISGLRAKRYEVRVRAKLTGGKLSAAVTAVGKPLLRQGATPKPVEEVPPRGEGWQSTTEEPPLQPPGEAPQATPEEPPLEVPGEVPQSPPEALSLEEPVTVEAAEPPVTP